MQKLLALLKYQQKLQGRYFLCLPCITDRRQLKTWLIFFQLSYPHLIFGPFDWHRYSGPRGNVRYLGHSKNLCLLTYLLRLALNYWRRHTFRR